MKSHGALTSEIGARLERDFKDYDVYYDHGERAEHVGKIVSSFGPKPARGTELGQLDIAVVERSTREVLALIEIEETNDEPKTILGDVFGALMGDQITFHGEPLAVGDWTTLIVMGQGDESHQKRNDFLARNVNGCQLSLSTANKWIREVVIESFADESKLEIRLKELVEGALKRKS